MRLKNLHVFLIYLFFTHVFYGITWKAGFVTDFTGLQERLAGANALGILNSFGFPSIQPFLNLFYFIFYKLFHIHALGWYLCFTSMHALNGFLIFRWSEQLLKKTAQSHAFLIAFWGALLFLCSPYQTEVVIWKVAFNFLLTTALTFNTLFFLEKWRISPDNQALLIIHSSFILALFTFELSLAIPFLVLIYLLWLPTKASIQQSLFQIILPQFLLLGGYFGLTKWVIGSWVGHYGPKVHFQFNWTEMVAHVWHYQAKFIGFTRYLDHQWKEKIYVFLLQPVVAYGLTTLVVIVLAYLFFRKKNPTAPLKIAGLLWLLFAIALLPIINLFFNYLLWVENDRYGYLASAFFYLLLVFASFQLPRLYRNVALIALVGFSSYLLLRTNFYWSKSTKLYWSLIEDFDAYQAETVYLLNLPDNMRGIPMFRDFSGAGKGFTDALIYLRQQPYSGQLFEVAQYNMTDASNGVNVTAPTPQNIVVTFNQWGNWWWRKGSGATNYETEQYQWLNEGHHYQLQLKAGFPQPVYLYQDKGTWYIFSPQNQPQ